MAKLVATFTKHGDCKCFSCRPRYLWDNGEVTMPGLFGRVDVVKHSDDTDATIEEYQAAGFAVEIE